MLGLESEYKKLFGLNKRWAKHWLTNTAHRAHSSTLNLIEPAKKTLEFIESIDHQDGSYECKIKLLNEFYNERNSEEKHSDRMGSDYYFNCIQYIKRAISDIEKGIPIIIPKMPRS
jgi:hypothetical protein